MEDDGNYIRVDLYDLNVPQLFKGTECALPGVYWNMRRLDQAEEAGHVGAQAGNRS